MLAGCAGKRVVESVPAPAPAPIAPVEIPGWEFLDELRPRPLFHDEGSRRVWDLGWLALSEDRLGEAQAVLGELENADPSAAIVALRGFVALRSGSTDTAFSLFRNARNRDPLRTDVELFATGGLFLTALNDERSDEAFEELDLIRALAPDHALVRAFHDSLRLELAERWIRLARETTPRDPAAAVDAYERTLRYVPDSTELHLEAAEALCRAGRCRGAEELAARAVSMRPGNVRALESYAELLAKNGKMEDALSVYERAHELDPFDERVSTRRRKLESELPRIQPPAEYFEARGKARITREDLAALLSVELAGLLPGAPPGPPTIVTDVHDRWAELYILDVLALGIVDARRNHTFAPEEHVRFRDLASAVGRAAGLVLGDCAPLAEPASASCRPSSSAGPPSDGLLPELPGASYVRGSLASAAVLRLAELARSCRRP